VVVPPPAEPTPTQDPAPSNEPENGEEQEPGDGDGEEEEEPGDGDADGEEEEPGDGEEEDGEDESTPKKSMPKETKDLPEFIKFKFDNKLYTDAYTYWPLSYKWEPAMLKSAYKVIESILYDALQDVGFLSEIYSIYSKTSIQFTKDILSDFKSNNEKMKTYIQHSVVTKHPHVKRILIKCMDEAISLWLSKTADECDPKHLATYTMFLLFFLLSDNQKKVSWIVQNVEPDGSKTPIRKEIKKSIQNAVKEFSDAFLMGETDVIDNLRNVGKETAINDAYDTFFVTLLEEALAEDDEAKMKGGSNNMFYANVNPRGVSRSRTLRNRGKRPDHLKVTRFSSFSNASP